MFGIMRRYSRGYRVQSIMSMVLVTLEVIMEMLIPTIMAYIIDIALPVASGMYVSGKEGMEAMDAFLANYPSLASGTTLLWILGGVCILFAGLGLLFGVLSARNVSVAGAGFASNLRLGIFSKIQSFSFANIDKFSTAGLVTRCTTDINNAQQSYQMLCRIVVRAPLTLIASVVLAFGLSPDISWVFLIALPLMGIIMATLSSFVMPRFKRMLRYYDSMNAMQQENIAGMRAVKAYVREEHETYKYSQRADSVRFAQLSAEKLMALVSPIMAMIMYGVTVLILYIGGGNIIKGTMSSGALTGLLSYAVQALMSVMMVSFVIIQLVMSRASINRITEVLDEHSTIVDGDSTHTVDSGKVVFDNVSFSYSGKDNCVLQDINLTIDSGEVVGIIAGTGEGKTSLVSLIPRLYDVYSGAVYVDGVDVRHYNATTLRDGVSMVLQKNVLFSGTIEDNLKWGNADATHQEVVEACKIAQAHDFVESFSDGYDTELGQGGVNVSGGQRQRLCIARALLKKPKIMILDDSTSAVDTATDASIRAGLKTLDDSMTVIIIAQRISSIEHCDKIVVLHEGKVDGIGTHAELIKNNKIYQEVYNSQNKEVA